MAGKEKKTRMGKGSAANEIFTSSNPSPNTNPNTSPNPNPQLKAKPNGNGI